MEKEFNNLKKLYVEYQISGDIQHKKNIISNATFNDRNPDETMFKDIKPEELSDIPYKLRTREVCAEITKRHPKSVEYIPNYLLVDESLLVELVKYDGMILEYILPRHQTSFVCIEAVKQNYFAIQFVHHQTPEVCIEALRQDEYGEHQIMKYIKTVYQTYEVCMEGIKASYGNCLKFIANPTHEMIIVAIKENSTNIGDVDNQTPEYCMLAIEYDDGMGTLGHIEEKYQTPEICMAAIRKNPDELKDVVNQTLEMCLEAIKLDPGSIYCVNPSVFYEN